MFKKKNYFFAILIFVIVSLSWIIPIIKSDSQVWENQYGKLEVYPMIADNVGWSFKQWFNATSYLPSQDLDIAFRFNDTIKGKLVVDNNSVSFEHISFNGYEWYIKKDVFFEQYQTVSGWWEYSTNYPVGKWDLFIKRSSDSLQYALDNDLFVHLDPWWNSSFSYRNCTNVCNNITNYQVNYNFTYDSHMQTNFSDIRWVGTKDNISFYELYWWVEDFSAGNWCNAWINISNSSWVCMYYGADVFFDDFMSGDGTFVFFDDFDGTTMDTSKWKELNAVTVDWSNDDYVYLSDDGFVSTVDQFGFGFAYETYSVADEQDTDFISIFKNPPVTDDCHEFWSTDAGSCGDDGDFNDYRFWNEEDNIHDYWCQANWGDITDWHINTIKRISVSKITFEQDYGVYSYDYTGGFIDDASMNMTFQVNDGSVESTLIVDWARIRYYNDITEPTFCNWLGEEEKSHDEYLISNPIPVNNSEIECLNLSQLCITVNSTFGSSSGWVNITLKNVTYSNVSFTGNGTYCLNISSFNLTQGQNYIWYINTSNGTAITNNSFFNFSCIVGCNCYNELMILTYKLNQILNDMLRSDSNMNIGIDTTQLSIFLTLVLFFIFFSIGYREPKKRTGGAFMMFSGFIFIGFSLLTSSIYNAVYIVPLMLPFAGFIIIVGANKWLYKDANDNTD